MKGFDNLEEVNKKSNTKLFVLAFSLTLFFAALEITYGFISGSLMVIGDGVHMSSDAIALGLSLIASILALKAANGKYTFGYKRFEPIAAFVNGLTLIIIPIVIIYEAIMRLINPVDILAKEMLIIGIIGLIINAIVGFILSKASSNLNVRSAMLHVLADMFTSFSAVVGALCILFFDWTWMDPIGSILTSAIIIYGGIQITKEAFRILMEGAPEEYSVENIKESIQKTSSLEVADLKLWCINEQDVYVMVDVAENLSEENASLIKQTLFKEHAIPLTNIYINKKSKNNNE